MSNEIVQTGQQVDFDGNKHNVSIHGKGEVRQASLLDWAKVESMKEEVIQCTK